LAHQGFRRLAEGKMGKVLVSERLYRVLLGALALVGVGFAGSAAAQDYDAGKTGPQLFASDCSACHKGPGGLAKGMDKGGLTSFLKEHYTSKQETADLLAAYLLGAGPGDAKQDKADVPGGPKSKTRKADREEEPKTDAKTEPKPHAEPGAHSEDENETHEDTAKRTQAGEHDAQKGPDEAILSKLKYYGSARGQAKDTARTANPQQQRLESYASSGSAAITPADSGAHDDAAPSAKRKTSEKKKKKDTDASASAGAEHPPRPARVIPAPPPPPPGNN
jgi:mono/diheme cytochrome c family protein